MLPLFRDLFGSGSSVSNETYDTFAWGSFLRRHALPNQIRRPVLPAIHFGRQTVEEQVELLRV